MIIHKARNKIYTNANNLNKDLIFFNANIKLAIANINDEFVEFVIIPDDKADNNGAVTCQRLYCDISWKELLTKNTYENIHWEDNSLVEDILLEKFNIKINYNDKNLSFIYWIAKFHKNPPKPPLLLGQLGAQQ